MCFEGKYRKGRAKQGGGRKRGWILWQWYVPDPVPSFHCFPALFVGLSPATMLSRVQEDPLWKLIEGKWFPFPFPICSTLPWDWACWFSAWLHRWKGTRKDRIGPFVLHYLKNHRNKCCTFHQKWSSNLLVDHNDFFLPSPDIHYNLKGLAE